MGNPSAEFTAEQIARFEQQRIRHMATEQKFFDQQKLAQQKFENAGFLPGQKLVLNNEPGWMIDTDNNAFNMRDYYNDGSSVPTVRLKSPREPGVFQTIPLDKVSRENSGLHDLAQLPDDRTANAA